MKLCPKCQKEFSDDANFCPVCASRLNAAAAPAEADSLAARFDLGAHIGGRRTGPVHRATDKTTGKPAAIKLIDPAVLALPGVAQRIERELKQLERVQSAGVAHVLASGRRGDDWWVATELLDGAQTLAEAIAARGPIPAEQAAELVELIGEALIEAAQVGVVHRDLAPKNVLFAGAAAQAQGNDGSVKLINFSLPVPTTEKVPGVPEFVAPEQVEGRAVDQRSNLYSLGALYYFVLTGEPIFSGSVAEVHEQHRSGTIKPASSIAKVPPAVEAVITRALDRSPTKRFLTVRQFVDEVTRVGHGEVIELKQTMMGRAGAGTNRPRGDLVSTLMGFRGAGGSPIIATPVAAATPLVATPVVATPIAATLVSGQAVAQTMHGTSSGAAAIAPAPRPATQPVVQATMGQAPIAVTQAPAVTAPVLAAPVVAAPVVAAPVVAAPVVGVGKQPHAATQASGAAAGKKKSDDGAAKGKFRETMWFKKGELDAQAAQAAAIEQARTGKVVDSDKADSLPIDERYKDDGSISRGDKEKYSLRTGATQMMAAIPDGKGDGGGKVSEDALIGEMKGGRKWVLVALAAAVVVIVILVFAIAR